MKQTTTMTFQQYQNSKTWIFTIKADIYFNRLRKLRRKKNHTQKTPTEHFLKGQDTTAIRVKDPYHD